MVKKELYENRLYELEKLTHRRFGVSCPICGKQVPKNDSKRLCGICAFEFGRDYPDIIINGIRYKSINHKGIDTYHGKLENANYIIVYRKYYDIVRYDDTILSLKDQHHRFSTYRIVNHTRYHFILEKGKLERWSYQDDGMMYNATRFVKNSNKIYEGAIL